MKTLRNPEDREEILRRLQAVQPGSPRRWGRMSSHQMICHLSDGFRLYLGEMTAKPVPVSYPRLLLRWVALWLPMPWPTGFKTVPELDQHGGGTPPAQFDADMRELRSLIERFTREPRDFAGITHPHFGKMSESAWMRLGYLHADHHLRQFGA
ncbi:MAG: DUF1569 domain-containing protein [Acidobacteriia bacterium]|nr:DUF1569 domain-containing protein [Terriglobia bacterium]